MLVLIPDMRHGALLSPWKCDWIGLQYISWLHNLFIWTYFDFWPPGCVLNGHAGFLATTKNHRKGTKQVQKLRHGPWTTPVETRRLFLLQLMSLFEYLWFMIDLWFYLILMRLRFIIQMFFVGFAHRTSPRRIQRPKWGTNQNQVAQFCSIPMNK